VSVRFEHFYNMGRRNSTIGCISPAGSQNKVGLASPVVHSTVIRAFRNASLFRRIGVASALDQRVNVEIMQRHVIRTPMPGYQMNMRIPRTPSGENGEPILIFRWLGRAYP